MRNERESPSDPIAVSLLAMIERGESEEAASLLTLRDYYGWVAEQKRKLFASLKGH